MSKKEVRWFSFPFVAPKGKGSKPEPAQGKIEEIEPPPESLIQSRWFEDPLRLTPEERRRRMIDLLVCGLNRLAEKQRKRSEEPQDNTGWA